MIVVTRLDGHQFGVNPDLVQRIDATPDTVLTLIDGTKYIVEESMDAVIALVNEHRAQLLARAQQIQASPRPSPVELVRSVPSADDEPDARSQVAPALPLRPRSR